MRQVIYYVASGPRPGLVWRFRCRVGTLSAPCGSTYYLWCVAPCGSGSGRLVDGAGTPARIGRTLTIAGRDYGKGEGGELCVLQRGGIPLSDPFLQQSWGQVLISD